MSYHTSVPQRLVNNVPVDMQQQHTTDEIDGPMRRNRVHLQMKNFVLDINDNETGDHLNLPSLMGNQSRVYNARIVGYNENDGFVFRHRDNANPNLGPTHRNNLNNTVQSALLLRILNQADQILRKCILVKEDRAPPIDPNYGIPNVFDRRNPRAPNCRRRVRIQPRGSRRPSFTSSGGGRGGLRRNNLKRKQSGGGGYSMNRNPKKIQREFKFGKKKKTKKISSQLKKLCKRLKVRLTVKRGKKRVYKSEKMLKAQCKKASGKKKKKVKRRRRRKFGPVNPATPLKESADAPSPSKELYGDEQDKLIFLTPGSSPSGPFSRRRRRSTGIRAGRPPPFNLYSPPSPPPFSLGDFGKKKKKKVKKRRKVVKKKKKSKRKRKK